MEIAKLFARIGLKDEASQGLGSFLNTLSNVTTATVEVARGVTDVARTIRDITQETLDAAAAFKQFESETGASAQELQKWQSVAEETNNSAEAITQSIKALATNREKIKLGQGDISGYQFLGINPEQDPFVILEQLREKTADLPQAMKKNVLAQMGISSELLQVLELTGDEFERMADNAFIIPDSALSVLNSARGATTRMSNAVKYLKSIIAVGLAPNIEKMSKKFADWVKINEKGIVEGFKKAWTWITKFINAVSTFAGIINNVVTRTIGWKNAIIGLIAVFAVLNSTLLLSPIGLITAGIIALILVLEDLYVYSQGGKSLFGKIMENFPGLEEGITNFLTTLKDLFSVIKGLWSGDTEGIDHLLEKWGAWGDVLKGIILSLKWIKDLLTGELSERKLAEAETLRQQGETAAADMIDFWHAGIGSEKWYNAMPGFLKADWWKQVASGGGFENVKVPSQTTVNADITINGAEDPEETARRTAEHLQNVVNSTDSQRARDE